MRTRALPQPEMGTCPLSSTCTRTGALGTRTRALKQPQMGTCPLSSTCTRTGALGTGTRALAPPVGNTGTACSTRWITSAKCGRNTPRTTQSTSVELSPLDRRLASITNTTSNQPVSVAMTYVLSHSAHRRAALVHHPRRDNTPPRRPRQRHRRLQLRPSSNAEVEVLTEVEV